VDGKCRRADVRLRALPPREDGTLYAELLGPAWLELAEPVRAAHASGYTLRASGRLRIGHGRTRAARWLARLLRLPRASDAADTRLVVTRSAGGEQWCRTFDDRRLDTWQYRAGDGALAERFGVLEFRFHLTASQGSLVMRQTDAAFRWGAVRLRIPAAWAPRVDAREDPAGARRIQVHVRVTVPLVGPVLTYDGTIDIEDTAA
jgi:Domain of unknown function (DUF4166)